MTNPHQPAILDAKTTHSWMLKPASGGVRPRGLQRLRSFSKGLAYAHSQASRHQSHSPGVDFSTKKMGIIRGMDIIVGYIYIHNYIHRKTPIMWDYDGILYTLF